MVQVYATDQSLGHRLDALDVLALSARELAGHDDADENRAPRSSAAVADDVDGSVIVKSGTGAGAGAGASAGAGSSASPRGNDDEGPGPLNRVGRVTRRLRATVRPTLSTNQFAPLASKVFFPLVRGFTTKVAGLDLLGKVGGTSCHVLVITAGLCE